MSTDLLARHALLCDDLEERQRVAVSSLEHLSHDGEQVPHTLRLSSAQRPQQTRPLRRGRRRRVAEVVDITTNTRSVRVTINLALLFSTHNHISFQVENPPP